MVFCNENQVTLLKLHHVMIDLEVEHPELEIISTTLLRNKPEWAYEVIRKFLYTVRVNKNIYIICIT